MEIVAFIFVIILCLYLLYLFSRHDFVLLRQNISLAQVYDAMCVSLISAFILGRVLFVVDNFRTELLSFLRFFHIIKYPGISFFGFILGAAICLLLIFWKKKGLGRIGDIFTLSFFPLFMLSVLIEKLPKAYYYVPYAIFVFLIFVFIFFIKSHQKYILRDGSITLIFFILICAQTALYEILNHKNAVIGNFTLLAIVSIVLIPVIFVKLVLNQRRKKT